LWFSTILLGSERSSWGCSRFIADKLSLFYPHGWPNVLLNSTCFCAVGSPLWIFHNSKACRLEKVWLPTFTNSCNHFHNSNSFYSPHYAIFCSTLLIFQFITHLLFAHSLFLFLQFFILRLYPWIFWTTGMIILFWWRQGRKRNGFSQLVYMLHHQELLLLLLLQEAKNFSLWILCGYTIEGTTMNLWFTLN